MQVTMEKINEFQDFLFEEMGDSRVQNWPLMNRPWMLLGLIIGYIFLVKKTLPVFMNKRIPYNLTTVIICYNLLQIVFNAMIAYLGAMTIWKDPKIIKCQPMDTSIVGPSMDLAKLSWWMFMLKLVDFTETIFFALRKKYGQISLFHVYHHSTAAILFWITAKYIPGGMSSICLILNSTVHTFMYTYYLLSSFGSNFKQITTICKPKLTLMQMISLCIIAAYDALTLLPNCEFPSLLGYSAIPILAVNIYFFYKFWKNNFTKEKAN